MSVKYPYEELGIAKSQLDRATKRMNAAKDAVIRLQEDEEKDEIRIGK